MPAVLIVPPTEFVTENVELRRRWADEARAWREGQMKALGIVGKPQETVNSGAFRGTEIYPLAGQDSQILYTEFLFPTFRARSTPLLRVAALLRRADCLCLGATWQTQGTPPGGFPSSLEKPMADLGKVARRNLDFQNSYRFEATFTGPYADRAQRLLDLVTAERFAATGLPVVSSLGRIPCDAQLPEPALTSEKMVPQQEKSAPQELALGPGLKESGYPARAHRVVTGKLRIQADPTPTPGWYRASGELALVSGVFGDRQKNAVLKISPDKPFDPLQIAEGALALLAPLTHKLDNVGFRITKREGRWVYLDRGRAFGLEIGTHLVARSAKLHVIQYAPWNEGTDVAIAMVRIEDPSAPLKPGDGVTFDATRYPLGKQGPAPIPLAPPR